MPVSERERVCPSAGWYNQYWQFVVGVGWMCHAEAVWCVMLCFGTKSSDVDVCVTLPSNPIWWWNTLGVDRKINKWKMCVRRVNYSTGMLGHVRPLPVHTRKGVVVMGNDGKEYWIEFSSWLNFNILNSYKFPFKNAHLVPFAISLSNEMWVEILGTSFRLSCGWVFLRRTEGTENIRSLPLAWLFPVRTESSIRMSVLSAILTRLRRGTRKKKRRRTYRFD